MRIGLERQTEPVCSKGDRNRKKENRDMGKVKVGSADTRKTKGEERREARHNKTQRGGKGFWGAWKQSSNGAGDEVNGRSGTESTRSPSRPG